MKRDFLFFGLCHPLSKYEIAEFMDIEGLCRSGMKGLRDVFGRSLREMSPDYRGIPRDVKIKSYPDPSDCLPYLRMLFNWKSCVVSFSASDGSRYTNFYGKPFYDDSKPDDNQKQALDELQRGVVRTSGIRLFMGKVVSTHIEASWDRKKQLSIDNEQMVHITNILPHLKSLELDFEFIDPALDLSLMSNLVELDLNSRYYGINSESFEHLYNSPEENSEEEQERRDEQDDWYYWNEEDGLDEEDYLNFLDEREERRERRERNELRRRLRALQHSEFFRNLSYLKKLRKLTLSSSSCTTTCEISSCLFVCVDRSVSAQQHDVSTQTRLPRDL